MSLSAGFTDTSRAPCHSQLLLRVEEIAAREAIKAAKRQHRIQDLQKAKEELKQAVQKQNVAKARMRDAEQSVNHYEVLKEKADIKDQDSLVNNTLSCNNCSYAFG